MNSLRARLILPLLAGGVLLLCVAGLALHWQTARALTSEFDSALRVALQSLAALTELRLDGAIGVETPEEILPQLAREHGSDVLLLRAHDGTEIERSRSLGDGRLPMIAGTVERAEFSNARLRSGVTLRCAGIRFTPKVEDEDLGVRKISPQVVLVIGRDFGTVERSLAALRTALILTGAVVMAVLASIVAWGVRRGLLPVRQLGEAVTNVNAASLSTRFATEPLPAELRPFAERLNALLARLEESFARERRFTATAAHELRTPLAELRTLAEVNLATPSSESERIESWKDALATTRRMESLALHLLELTRAEDTQRVVQKSRIAVADAIADAWKPHAPHALGRRVSLNVSIPADIAVSGDPVLLGVVLGNLCGNAAEHAAEGSGFCITAERTGSSVAIHFRNRAEALDEKDLAHLFERFWRKDEARSDGTHHGLGLSVAHEFAKLLGGSLAARIHRESGGGELELVLSLPFAT